MIWNQKHANVILPPAPPVYVPQPFWVASRGKISPGKENFFSGFLHCLKRAWFKGPVEMLIIGQREQEPG